MEDTARLNARAIAIVAPWGHPLSAKDVRYRQFQNFVYVHSFGDHTYYWAGGPHRFCMIRLPSVGQPVKQLAVCCPKDYIRPYKSLKSEVASELIINQESRTIEHCTQKSSGASQYVRYDWDDRIEDEAEWLSPIPFITRLREPKLLCTTPKAAFEWDYLNQIASTGDELLAYKIVQPEHKAVRIMGDYQLGYVIDWGNLERVFALIAPCHPVGTTERARWADAFCA
ncbi:hypothetical protein VZG28_04800 [Synechococcus elongatus IITB4]|uniref:hypothetical protein n=1 Tax=Synechococcus elongatus TaxID=32046 RepID=UPI0030CCBB01